MGENGRPGPEVVVYGGDDLLPAALACPRCGERRADWLVWDDDAVTVTCANCGHARRPGC